MGKDIDVFPDSINLNLNGNLLDGVDLDLDLAGAIALNGNLLDQVALNGNLLENVGASVTLKGGVELDLGLDNIKADLDLDLGLDDIRIRELAPIRLEFGLKPMRIHAPINLSYGICLFGIEVLSFVVCGESMLVIEDYSAHETEVCE